MAIPTSPQRPGRVETLRRERAETATFEVRVIEYRKPPRRRGGPESITRRR
jgi:hypothetical protein